MSKYQYLVETDIPIDGAQQQKRASNGKIKIFLYLYMNLKRWSIN